VIRVQVAATCNNSCVFCAQAGRFDAADATRIAQGPHGVDAVGSPVGVAPLDPGHLARGVDARLKALSKSAEPVMLIGGEPTLDPALCEYVRRLAAGGAAVVLQTNARLLGCRVDAAGAVASQGDATLAEALKGAGLTAVEVALYGSTAALHDYHTRCPGSFRQTVSGVRASRSAGLRCALSSGACTWRRRAGDSIGAARGQGCRVAGSTATAANAGSAFASGAAVGPSARP